MYDVPAFTCMFVTSPLIVALALVTFAGWFVTASGGAHSTAPMSQRDPIGLGTPRWSVVISLLSLSKQPAELPLSIPLLPGSSLRVSVGPPFFCSAEMPGEPVRSFITALVPHSPEALTRLLPCDSGLSPPQFGPCAAVPSATIVFFIT